MFKLTRLAVSAATLMLVQSVVADVSTYSGSPDETEIPDFTPSIYLNTLIAKQDDSGLDPFNTRGETNQGWLLAQADQDDGGQAEAPGGEGGGEGGGDVNTGNDPRDFGHKFMPYYRFTELKNGTEMHSTSIFGLWAITKNFALTYELPIGMQMDIRDTDACAGLPDIDCTGNVPGQGYLPNGLPAEGDGVETGMGDTILRLIWDTGTDFLGGALLPGFQLTVPTATDAILGSESVSGGPILTNVWDFKAWPAPGAFIAMMHIFEVDFYKEQGRGDIGRYLGRWFVQTPINKKHKLYIMTEIQPIYDWENDHFSLWIGPEFGKAFTPSKGIFRNGGAIYIKPGFGIGADKNSGDRSWSIEVGFRAFFPSRNDMWDIMSMGN